MLVLTILLVLIIFSFYKNVNRRVFALLILLIVLIESIRWESGTDFDLYLNTYSAVLSKDYDFFQRIDFLYYPLNYLFSVNKIDYTLFLFVLSLFSYSLIYITVPKYTNQYFVALLFIYTYFIGSLGANRQMIAICITFFSSIFIQEKKWHWFIIGIMIASLFHISAIVALPMIFLNKRIDKKIILLTLFFVVFVSLWNWQIILRPIMLDKDYFGVFFSEKMKIYFDQNITYKTNYFLFFGGVMRRVLPIITLLFFSKELINKPNFNLIFNIGIVSLLLYIYCALNFQFLLGRLTIYYSIYDVIVCAWVVEIYNQSKKRNIVLSILAFLAIIFFFKSVSVYIDLFIPYQTRFFTF